MKLIVKYKDTKAKLPTKLMYKDKEFRLSFVDGNHVYEYCNNTPFQSKPFSYFQFTPNGREPKEITIGGKKYSLFRERIYIPVAATPSEIEDLFDSLAKNGYEKDFIIQEFNIKVYQKLFDLVLSGHNQVDLPLILDFGCGVGVSIRAASIYGRKIRLIGVDISNEMSKLSSINGLAVVEIGWKDNLPIKSEAFDATVMSFVSNFLKDTNIYRHIWHIMKKGGRIAFNLYHPQKNFKQYYYEILSKSGFEKINIEQRIISSNNTTRQSWFVNAEKPK